MAIEPERFEKLERAVATLAEAVSALCGAHAQINTTEHGGEPARIRARDCANTVLGHLNAVEPFVPQISRP